MTDKTITRLPHQQCDDEALHARVYEGNSEADVVAKAARDYSSEQVDLLFDYVCFDEDTQKFYLDQDGLNQQLRHAYFDLDFKLDCEQETRPSLKEACDDFLMTKDIREQAERARRAYDDNISDLRNMRDQLGARADEDPLFNIGAAFVMGIGVGWGATTGLQYLGHGHYQDWLMKLTAQYEELRELYLRVEVNRKINEKGMQQYAEGCGFQLSRLTGPILQKIGLIAIKALFNLKTLLITLGILAAYETVKRLPDSSQGVSSQTAGNDSATDSVGFLAQTVSPNMEHESMAGVLNRLGISEENIKEDLVSALTHFQHISRKESVTHEMKEILDDISVQLFEVKDYEEAEKIYRDRFTKLVHVDFRDQETWEVYQEASESLEEIFSLEDWEYSLRENQAVWMAVIGIGGFLGGMGFAAEGNMDMFLAWQQSGKRDPLIAYMKKNLEREVDRVVDRVRFAISQGTSCAEADLRLQDHLDNANPNNVMEKPDWWIEIPDWLKPAQETQDALDVTVGYVPFFESASTMTAPALEVVPEIVPDVMAEPANTALFQYSAETFAATGTDGPVRAYAGRTSSARPLTIVGEQGFSPTANVASQAGVNNGAYSTGSVDGASDVTSTGRATITPAGFVKGAVTFYVVYEGTQWVLREIHAPEEVTVLARAGFTVYALDVVRRNPSLIGATAGSLSSAIFFGEVTSLGLENTNLDPETKQLITQGVALTGALATGATIVGVSARFGGGVGLLTGLGIAGISAIGTSLIRSYKRGKALDEVDQKFRADMAEQNAIEAIALFEDMKKVFEGLIDNDADGADFILEYLATNPAYQMISRMMGWWFFEKYGDKILSRLSSTAKEKFYDVMFPGFAAAMERFEYHLDAAHPENFDLNSYEALQALVADSEHKDMWSMVGYFVTHNVIDPWLTEDEYSYSPRQDYTQEVLALRDHILNSSATEGFGDHALETRGEVEGRRAAEGRADRLYDEMTKDLREPSRFFPGAGDLGATFWTVMEDNLVSVLTLGDRSDTEKARILWRFYDDVSDNLEAREFYNGPFALIEASTYGHYLDQNETAEIKGYLSSFETRLKAFERTGDERYIDPDSTNQDSVFFSLRQIAEIFQKNT